MRRILVTGADGFVGRHLRPALQQAFPAAEIVATGLAAGAGAGAGTERTLDVTDEAAVAAVFAAVQPQACVHLAGVAAPAAAAAAPARAWEVNLHGALNVGAAIMAAAPECRLLFVSSAEVYGAGFRAGLAVDETALLAPMTVYAATKAAAELGLGAMAARGLRLLRLRPFNHTGAGQTEAFVAAAFAAQIAGIEAGTLPPVLKVGALTPERDFLDVRDVCAAYTAALARFDALPANTVLNIASGRAVRIGDLLGMLLAQARREISVQEDPARLRPVEIARAVGDAGLAQRLLGWAPAFGLEETLATVLAAARDEAGKLSHV